MPSAIYPSAIGAYHDAEGRWCCTVEMDGIGWAQPELQVKRLHNCRAGEELDLVWQQLCLHGLKKLRVQARETPLLLTEPATASAATRLRTTELAFETLGTPALCVARTPELAAIAAGRVTSAVLEMGAFQTTSSAVVDGVMQPRSVQTSKLSAGNLARLLEQQQTSKGIVLEPACCLPGLRPPSLGGAAGSSHLVPNMPTRPTAGRPPVVPAYSEQLKKLRREELARELFEVVCSVTEKQSASPSKQAAQPQPQPVDYTLPDGRVISVGAERFKLPEYLFQGSTNESGGGQQLHPLQTMVLHTLQLCEGEHHKELMRNMVLTGGGSCLAGVGERLEAELKGAARRLSSVQTIASQAHRIVLLSGGSNHERKHGAWLGGSILGSLRTQHELWMSRAEYEEHGSALIHRKGMRCV